MLIILKNTKTFFQHYLLLISTELKVVFENRSGKNAVEIK